MRLSRRSFLAGVAALVAAGCSRDDDPAAPTFTPSTAPPPTTGTTATAPTTTAAPTTTTAPLAADPFRWGVASGDPLPDAVVLWTRLDVDADTTVTWQVSADDGAEVATGQVTATGDDAFCVHVDATGLAPDTWYTYQFSAGGFTSVEGRTRTMPADDAMVERLVVASGSCQHWETGWYTAYDDLVARRVDLVLWLGDYIYEGAGQPVGEGRVRAHPPEEAATLATYRERYAQYRSDPALQRAHAAAPWLVVWDDHEVDNNYAGLVSQDGDPTDVFATRRADAYRAWWEHMPVRLPRPVGDELTIRREVRAGRLATFLLLDGRQYRSDQACGDRTLSLDPPCPEVTAPGRTMLGDDQEAWLEERLAADEAVWTVLGNQVVLTDARVGGAILNHDQWDGYPEARRRLVGALAEHGRGSVVVVTGDIHLAGVGNVADDAGALVATELITTSISSDGNVPEAFEPALQALPNIVWGELRHRGYSLHEITPDAWTATYRIVDDVKREGSPVTTAATFTIEPGRPGARQTS
jgi:alkaline phosphatase D